MLNPSIVTADGTLSEMLMNEEGEMVALDRTKALFYFRQLLNGVDFLHKSGILHLNLKGENLQIFEEGRVLKICGFGKAIHIDDVVSFSIGSSWGNPLFRAPEVCKT